MKFVNKLKKFIITNFYDNTYVFNFILLFFSLFSTELILRLITHYNIISYGTLRILLFDIILTYIILFIINFFKSLTKKIITGVISFFVSFYACLQLGFLNFLGVFISLQSASQAGAVVDYVKDFLKSFRPIYLTTFIPFVIVLLVLIFVKKRFYKNDKLRLFFFTLVTAGLFGCIYYEVIIDTDFQNPVQSVDNSELFLTASNPSLTVSEFGVLRYGISDLRNKFFPVKVETNIEVVNENNYSTTDNVINGIDDNIWEYLISTEENSDYNYLNKYYYNKRKATTNDYTGIFKDKNLIVIMMESVNDIFLEYPEYFPNINKLLTGGWSWENYYSPRNSCATLNNEFSGMTGLYSISNMCTAKSYENDTYFESIFNVFKDSNYKTFSAHDYTEHYYPRRVVHQNMGSDRYYGVEDLGIPYDPYNYRNWTNDDDFMRSVLNIIDGLELNEDGHFMSWLTTVSSHQPYNMDSNQGNKYYSMTSGTGFNPQIRRYMSKLKILDDGIGVLIDGLSARGMLDDTVIVLYGDHYPYGIDTNILNTVMSYDTNVDMNAEQVPFIIYNSEVTEESPYVYTNYSTYVNVLPTVANLFDLKYESRLYMGEDLFSDYYNSIAVFSDGSWKNENAFYNAASGAIKYYSSFEYTPDEIKKINDRVSGMLKSSALSVTTNYFDHLLTRVNERLEELEVLSNTACLLNDNTLYITEEHECKKRKELEEIDSEIKEEVINE